MGVSMVGGVVVGYYLDKIFKTFPLISGIFFIAGIAAGTNIAFYIIKRFKKNF